jgi:hypothetical protein
VPKSDRLQKTRTRRPQECCQGRGETASADRAISRKCALGRVFPPFDALEPIGRGC